MFPAGFVSGFVLHDVKPHFHFQWTGCATFDGNFDSFR